ncbi:MAG: hypothetical protein KDB22_00900 [Planctomycetales bacterium]|nr:hypothetical protein [Planctomycetales bacterium]
MELSIGEYVLSGELRNTRRNGVFGWIEFAPDYGIRIELTGNFSGDLAGKTIRFSVPDDRVESRPQPGSFPDSVEKLADRQIGVVGEISLSTKQVPNVPPEVFAQLDVQERDRHSQTCECLHLEWFGQNGRVVADVVSPSVTILDSDAEQELDNDRANLDDGNFGLGFTEVHLENEADDAELLMEDDEDSEVDDPYGLFDESLDQSVAESLGTPPADNFETPESGPRNWEEVIPGIDPATKEMYEQWDEIFEGKKDEPISYLFDKPLKLPRPELVDKDEVAWPLVTAILAQLARLSVALDVCEHFSATDTYHLLMSEILPNAKVHPNLAASEMVQHYSTSDYCDVCDAEYSSEDEESIEPRPDGGSTD